MVLVFASAQGTNAACYALLCHFLSCGLYGYCVLLHSKMSATTHRGHGIWVSACTAAANLSYEAQATGSNGFHIAAECNHGPVQLVPVSRLKIPKNHCFPQFDSDSGSKIRLGKHWSILIWNRLNVYNFYICIWPLGHFEKGDQTSGWNNEI